MTRPAKIVLGVATIWPVVFLGAFISVMIGMAVLEANRMVSLQNVGPIVFAAAFGLYFLTMAGMLVLMVIYIVHIVRNKRFDVEKKVLWAAVIVFAGIFAMPVYWYLYVWREPEIVPR